MSAGPKRDPDFDYALAAEVLRLSQYPSPGWAYGIVWRRPWATSEVTLMAVEQVLLSRGAGKELLPAPWYPAAVQKPE